MVMCADSSGDIDPANSGAQGTTLADAAWLDIVWLNSGSGKYHRLQTAYAKHNKRVSVIYVDGHSARSRPSQLTWRQFWGNSDPTKSAAYLASAICNSSKDGAEWSSVPE